ncbi:MAG: phosphoenolpyruvate carboxykinase (ATP) [Bacteriovorax sp.]|jgi:phosphoenolpyruvate carboxykinase (ATP)
MDTLLNLIDQPTIFQNSYSSLLIEKAIIRGEGNLGPHGELIVRTGKHTGRSPNDKYVVMNEVSESKIWWENNIHKMDQEKFDQLTDDVITYLNQQDELFYTQQSIGAPDIFSLGIEFLTSRASAAFFSQYMFKKFEKERNEDVFRIIHAPDFKLDPAIYGTRSETVIVTCFKRKITIIAGTRYAGEIKKSMFSVMNFLTPDKGILPMHSGANQNSEKETFVYFGLSGTGKTTLSVDVGLDLIGDDEHGLSDKGVFNFEGGCYAKTYKLSPETEPAIYSASTRFASFLENVKLKEDRSSIDFFDDSLTENGRSSYPLAFIEDRVESGKGQMPKHIFYLSADAFGVLPPVSLLTPAQAVDYFVLGYSAKLAGTEVGIKTPEATFSPCFGAPFMLRQPAVYSRLLKEFVTKYQIKVWLINTGWFGGSYGKGTRFPLKDTRNIIRSVQAGLLDHKKFVLDEIFGLKIPVDIEIIDNKILNPINSWPDRKEYIQSAEKLSNSFKKQLEKLSSSSFS